MTETYKKIIDHSIENSDVKTEDHLIEEMSELISELCNKKRGRPHKTWGEMADVLFQIDKVLKENYMDIEYLRGLSIIKSKEKYPEFMESIGAM